VNTEIQEPMATTVPLPGQSLKLTQPSYPGEVQVPVGVSDPYFPPVEDEGPKWVPMKPKVELVPTLAAVGTVGLLALGLSLLK
jgi:hypothetical protein